MLRGGADSCVCLHKLCNLQGGGTGEQRMSGRDGRPCLVSGWALWPAPAIGDLRNTQRPPAQALAPRCAGPAAAPTCACSACDSSRARCSLSSSSMSRRCSCAASCRRGACRRAPAAVGCGSVRRSWPSAAATTAPACSVRAARLARSSAKASKAASRSAVLKPAAASRGWLGLGWLVSARVSTAMAGLMAEPGWQSWEFVTSSSAAIEPMWGRFGALPARWFK